MSDLVVIYSGEHKSYWRENGCGYTLEIANAGRYTREDATTRTKHCGPEKKIKLRKAPKELK